MQTEMQKSKFQEEVQRVNSYEQNVRNAQMLYEIQNRPKHEPEFKSYKRQFQGMPEEITYENFGVVNKV